MKHFGYLGLSFFSLTVFSENTPDLLLPGGGWWKPKSVIKIENPVHLHTPTQLDADEVHINAKIVTNGNSLDVHARRIVFGTNGNILSFEGPAPQGKPGAGFGGPAAASSAERGRGTDGELGRVGNRGANGLGADGKSLPGEVFLFAAEIDGEPKIDGRGQKGGRGGDGGTGQSGGSGGPGKKARSSCFPANRYGGGPGGSGGNFGIGGQGGKGGRGGTPTPITLAIAWQSAPSSYPLIVNGSGLGGTGGQPGMHGAPGSGGPGGPGDESSCLVYSDSRPSGPNGPTGEACFDSENPANNRCPGGNNDCRIQNCTWGFGRAGQTGPSGADVLKEKYGRTSNNEILFFNEFESLRFKTTLAWYEFHWRRLFEDLLHSSVYLLDDLVVSEKENAQGLDATLALDGAINDQVVKLIRREWEHRFTHPLSQEMDKYRTQKTVRDRIQWALGKASFFTKSLAEVDANRSNNENLKAFKTLLKQVRTERAKLLEMVASECKTYLITVVQSDRFRRQLFGRQYHFDIPACTQIESFQSDKEGPMRPIILVADIEPRISDNLKGQVKLESIANLESASANLQFLSPVRLFNTWKDLVFGSPLFAADPDPHFNFTLVKREKVSDKIFALNYPKANFPSRLSELGYLKGYQTLPHKAIVIENLVQQLEGLVSLAGDQP